MLQNIGANVRRLRRDRGLTQTQLAQAAGTRQSQLSQVERGLRPSAELFVCLCQALGVEPDELLRAADPAATRSAMRFDSLRFGGPTTQTSIGA